MNPDWKERDRELRRKCAEWNAFREQRLDIPSGFYSPLKGWIDVVKALANWRIDPEFRSLPGWSAGHERQMVVLGDSLLRTGFKTYCVSNQASKAAVSTKWSGWDLIEAPLPVATMTMLFQQGNRLANGKDVHFVLLNHQRAADGTVGILVNIAYSETRFMHASYAVDGNEVQLQTEQDNEGLTEEARAAAELFVPLSCGLMKMLRARPDLVEANGGEFRAPNSNGNGKKREKVFRPTMFGRTFRIKGSELLGSKDFGDKIRLVHGFDRRVRGCGNIDWDRAPKIWIEPHYAAKRTPEMQAAKEALKKSCPPPKSPNRTRDWNRPTP